MTNQASADVAHTPPRRNPARVISALLSALLTVAAIACTSGLAPVREAEATPHRANQGKHSIQDLAHMIGTWDCREVFHAGGWSPKEIVTENARDVFSWGPGKKFILADYESISEFGLFEAHDVIFWDEAQKTFKFLFFDSFSGGMQEQDGVLEGNVLTFSHRMEMNGKKGTFVRVYRFPSKNKQSLDVEFRQDDGKVVRIATIDKTRRP